MNASAQRLLFSEQLSELLPDSEAFAQPFGSAVYGSFTPVTLWPGCTNPVSVPRAEEDGERLLPTAAQHRNVSAGLKQRDVTW